LTSYQHAPNCEIQEAGQDWQIVNTVSKISVRVNQTAGLVWQLCETYSTEQIIQGLQAQYPENAEQIPTEITNTIKELVNQSVLIEKA
jgi:hypothetical protein